MRINGHIHKLPVLWRVVVIVLLVALVFYIENGGFISYLNSETVNTQVTISESECGNNIVEPGEECDGDDLNEYTCSNLGYTRGILSCTQQCEFNTNLCFNTSGGGGGGYPSQLPQLPLADEDTIIEIHGWAYPEGVVTVYVDGERQGTVTTEENGAFLASYALDTPERHRIVLLATDNKKGNSSSYGFSAHVIEDTTTLVQNIFLSPTIVSMKRAVTKGNPITFFGQTVPSARVDIVVADKEASVIADGQGRWVYVYDTSTTEKSSYTTQVQAFHQGLISEFSQPYQFSVGDRDEVVEDTPAEGIDLNEDKEVNLIDFSILVYWYQRPAAPEVLARVDLNHDGVVDLVDFSILAFYWTG